MIRRIAFSAIVLCTAACASSNKAGTTDAWPPLSSWPNGQDRDGDVAVIVALEDYAFLPDVPGAVRNANDWESYFRAHGASEVLVLANSDAPREEILGFAKRGAGAVAPGARLWFVFIGHGAPTPDGKDGVLVGMDARQTPDSLAARGLGRSELLEALAGPQEQTIVVLDTCFSGRASGGETLATGAQPVVPVGELSAPANTLVFTAAQADQFAGALPNADRPAFSYLLLGALRGWADDGDGAITADEARDWTAKQLRQVPGRTQTPSLDGDPTTVLGRAGEADPGVAALMRGATPAPVAVAQPTGPVTPPDDPAPELNDPFADVPTPPGWTTEDVSPGLEWGAASPEFVFTRGRELLVVYVGEAHGKGEGGPVGLGVMMKEPATLSGNHEFVHHLADFQRELQVGDRLRAIAAARSSRARLHDGRRPDRLRLRPHRVAGCARRRPPSDDPLPARIEASRPQEKRNGAVRDHPVGSARAVGPAISC